MEAHRESRGLALLFFNLVDRG